MDEASNKNQISSSGDILPNTAIFKPDVSGTEMFPEAKNDKTMMVGTRGTQYRYYDKPGRDKSRPYGTRVATFGSDQDKS